MNCSNAEEGRLSSLLYVSRSCISQKMGSDEISAIVQGSLARNSRLGVTGALIFTGVHFAQILEGPKLSLRELMASICSDERHRDITTVVDRCISTRAFGQWAMAYSGCSTYLDRHIKPLFDITMDEEEKHSSVDRMVQIMRRVPSLQPH